MRRCEDQCTNDAFPSEGTPVITHDVLPKIPLIWGRTLPTNNRIYPWATSPRTITVSNVDRKGGATSYVRFTPNSDRKSGLPQTVMSALPPKADMCSVVADVRYGPIADIALIIRSTRRHDQLTSVVS